MLRKHGASKGQPDLKIYPKVGSSRKITRKIERFTGVDWRCVEPRLQPAKPEKAPKKPVPRVPAESDKGR